MNIKNEDKFLSMLYGCNDSYGMNIKEIKTILKEHVKSLENLYNVIEDLDNTDNIEDLYNLGDIINLVEYVANNIKKEESVK